MVALYTTRWVGLTSPTPQESWFLDVGEIPSAQPWGPDVRRSREKPSGCAQGLLGFLVRQEHLRDRREADRLRMAPVGTGPRGERHQDLLRSVPPDERHRPGLDPQDIRRTGSRR